MWCPPLDTLGDISQYPMYFYVGVSKTLSLPPALQNINSDHTAHHWGPRIWISGRSCESNFMDKRRCWRELENYQPSTPNNLHFKIKFLSLKPLLGCASISRNFTCQFKVKSLQLHTQYQQYFCISKFATNIVQSPIIFIELIN